MILSELRKEYVVDVYTKDITIDQIYILKENGFTGLHRVCEHGRCELNQSPLTYGRCRGEACKDKGPRQSLDYLVENLCVNCMHEKLISSKAW